MSEFFNEEGEPLMDGVSMMREGYYAEEYDVDDYYDRDGGWEPEPQDPSDCEHGNGSFPEGAGFACRDCDHTLEGPRLMPGVDDYWQTGDFFTYDW